MNPTKNLSQNDQKKKGIKKIMQKKEMRAKL